MPMTMRKIHFQLYKYVRPSRTSFALRHQLIVGVQRQKVAQLLLEHKLLEELGRFRQPVHHRAGTNEAPLWKGFAKNVFEFLKMNEGFSIPVSAAIVCFTRFASIVRPSEDDNIERAKTTFCKTIK